MTLSSALVFFREDTSSGADATSFCWDATDSVMIWQSTAANCGLDAKTVVAMSAFHLAMTPTSVSTLFTRCFDLKGPNEFSIQLKHLFHATQFHLNRLAEAHHTRGRVLGLGVEGTL